MAEWVQHKSRQGEKFEVIHEDGPYKNWGLGIPVKPNEPLTQEGQCLWLPKSEYVYCNPPDQWCEIKVNVADKDSLGYQDIKTDGHCVIGLIKLNMDYRVKSLNVERRIT